MNNYNSEDIEKYILAGYTPNKGRTIPKSLLFTGIKLNFFAVMILAGTVVLTIESFNVNMLSRSYYVFNSYKCYARCWI